MAASVAIALFAGCGKPAGIRSGANPAAAPVLPPAPLAQLLVLEAAGGAPEDTTVTLAPGARRVIVLRRSAPDFGLFAELEFFPGRDTTQRGAAPARITIRPTPGKYGLTLEIEGVVTDSATITFSFGQHFVAPAGARERYGSNLGFEKALAIGRLGADGIVVFLPSIRPATDMLMAPIQGPGRYLVAAPR